MREESRMNSENKMNACEVRDQIHERLVIMGVPDPGMACTREFIEFNPLHEQSSLLREWLIYRGFTMDQIPSEPQTLALEEIQRNGRPFAGFDGFDPNDASDEFLRIWLSWYGVSEPASASRLKLIGTTQKLLGIVRKLTKDETPLYKFDKLVSLQRRLRQKERALGRLLFMLTRLEPEKEFSSKELNRKDNEGLIKWGIKMLFAKSLEASAIAAPYVLWKVTTDVQKKRQEKKAALIDDEKQQTYKRRLITELSEETPVFAANGAIYTLYGSNLASAIFKDAATRGKVLPINVLGFFTTQLFASNPSLPRIMEGIIRQFLLAVYNVTSEIYQKQIDSKFDDLVRWLSETITNK
jgi:hypothetical protein